MVQAGVSVLSSASQILLNKRIRDMEQHWNDKIRVLTKSNNRFRRCKFSDFESRVVSFILMLLVNVRLHKHI